MGEFVGVETFKVVFRERGMLTDRFVRARDLAWAERVGRKWCLLLPGRTFVRVDPVVVCGEEVLAEEVEAYRPPRLENFEGLSVVEARGAVERGEIGVEEALSRERGARNRKGLLEWLEGRAGVPF